MSQTASPQSAPDFLHVAGNVMTATGTAVLGAGLTVVWGDKIDALSNPNPLSLTAAIVVSAIVIDAMMVAANHGANAGTPTEDQYKLSKRALLIGNAIGAVAFLGLTGYLHHARTELGLQPIQTSYVEQAPDVQPLLPNTMRLRFG